MITPSLWSQDIIDALMVEAFGGKGSVFAASLERYSGSIPSDRFETGTTVSLSTAGFPNAIAVLLPGKEAAMSLGKELTTQLTQEWETIGNQVKEDIKREVQRVLGEKQPEWDEWLETVFPTLSDRSPYQRELDQLLQGGCWEWNKLWEAQLAHAWEPYWAAVPLGDPQQSLAIEQQTEKFAVWKDAQDAIAQPSDPLPSEAEAAVYHRFNVGTWWGSLQQRLRQLVQAVKNTRTWSIPAAPGERSTVSGQFSAAHPRLHYDAHRREGGGLPESSMRLFWFVMSKAYPGLFNGSEKLNCLELTKRMAWQYGGVGQVLGIAIELVSEELPEAARPDLYDETEDLEKEQPETIDYGQLVRFPNLSSIAAARFARQHPRKVRQYWKTLAHLIRRDGSLKHRRRLFGARTRGRPFHLRQTDAELNPQKKDGQNYNGVMFSSKWLADDMGLKGGEVEALRGLVEKAHQQCQFGEGSPADWWAIVLADGDGMGDYISGENLHPYENYLIQSAIQPEGFTQEQLAQLLTTQKRMGPATHIGLNRALLDFSNRLVPYLTEQRFCGRVIYSGGDDVMVVLPLEDLPEYLLSLQAAWCGDARDPYCDRNSNSKDPAVEFSGSGGYWQPHFKTDEARDALPNRPLFTMGRNATMSMGIAIAYKSVPLPTVLESLWEAEGLRAKHMPGKNGLCFRVIYGSSNQLEALMNGNLLRSWWPILEQPDEKLSPALYRLAEELPKRAEVTENLGLCAKAAKVILNRRDAQAVLQPTFDRLEAWIGEWEQWAWEERKKERKRLEEKHGEDLCAFGLHYSIMQKEGSLRFLFNYLSFLRRKTIELAKKRLPLGTTPDDLGKLLRFSAFWVDKMVQRQQWAEAQEVNR